MRQIFSIQVLALSILMIPDMTMASEKARTDRYTLVSMDAKTDQLKPLSAITSVTLGRDVSTVGEAVNEILKGSGYRWREQNQEDQLLKQLPLPAIARQLGPIRLEDALQTLAGEAWKLKVDNLNRIVWFEINQSVITHSEL